MKTRTFLAPIGAGLGLILIVACGCARSDKAAQAASVPTPQRTGEVQPAAPTARPVRVSPVAANSISAPAGDSWAAIKDMTYEQRAEFIAGAASLEEMLAGQISELNARRAAMTANTTDWDFAMKELNDSRAYLKSMVEEAGRATPETWDQEKDKVSMAWQRAEEACEKVRMSTTS